MTTAIYESSCEAYKLIGSSSGFYSIDPDGSGPLGPAPVYCNMTDGRPLSWWVDQEGERHSYWGGFLSGVQQCSCSLEENCIDMNYFCNCDADIDTWANDTGVLSYKDHLPVSHIVIGDTNRTGSEAIYRISPLRCYGDSGTASQQRGFLGCIRTLTFNGVTFDLEERAKMVPGVSSGCPGYCSSSSSLCHNKGKCIEKSSGYTCDCSQSAFGGPTCKEESIWNAASFYQESSSLLFPTLRAELTFDISFYFKTTANSGVFLENMGHKDFIRVELSLVSVSFDRESSMTFTFQEPFSVMRNRSSQASSARRESIGRAREDVAFTFITSQSPALLLTVITFSKQYIAVILTHNGSLQIWYHLQIHRTPDVFSPILSSLADGQIHRIRIHREGKDLYVQIDQDIHTNVPRLLNQCRADLNQLPDIGQRRDIFQEEVLLAGSKGFIGCLSSVQFNHVAPLKAALLNRGSSLITIRGPLMQSNCGALADSITSKNLRDQTATTNKDKEQHGADTQNDVAVIAGPTYVAIVDCQVQLVPGGLRKLFGSVVTVVVFIAVCILAVVTRRLYLRQAHRTNHSIKEKEHHHSVETGNRTELHLHNSVRDNMKEYYI
ncbi:contactin-associated protein-like 5 [Morone saxatilis]|uniref:contactin-associated protein-like 5 n=1 Tax=Morone saxatilis TaxID=34816 RepID=UPI0015E1D5E8|nr:contactin-associated protein-like 5 [Morone saxatilis]